MSKPAKTVATAILEKLNAIPDGAPAVASNGVPPPAATDSMEPVVVRDWQRPAVICERLKMSRSGLHKMATTVEDFPQPWRLGHKHTLYDWNEVSQFVEARRVTRQRQQAH